MSDLVEEATMIEQEVLLPTKISPSGYVYTPTLKKMKPKKASGQVSKFAEFAHPIPVYFEQDGLRKVKPYTYAFSSFVKERWQDRTLIDVYSNEFRDRSSQYYDWAIESGSVLVNNEIAKPDRILKNGDILSNISHRHEPAVIGGQIKIIYDGRLPGNDGETLVVEKPGSMPVHSTGRYHFNSLLSILKYDYNLPLVHTSNRLDRLTSGVMICSLSVEKSKSLGAWFGGQRPEGGVHKEYLARCVGRFPDGETICTEPLLTLDRGIGINVVHPEGRASRTLFERLSYHAGSDTSVVHCRPITGRSHQIRVHLQWLGYPIANDPVYRDERAWGESGGKGGVFNDASSSTPEQAASRQLRRDMGEKVLQRELEKMKVRERKAKKASMSGSNSAAQPSFDKLTGDAIALMCGSTGLETDGSAKDASISVFNRSGAIRSDLLLDASGSNDQDARLVYKLELSTGASNAIEALKGVRDAEDGWSRWRDMKGVERAREKGSNGIIDQLTPSSSSPPHVLPIPKALPISPNQPVGNDISTHTLDPEDLPSDVYAPEPDESFCEDCFLPLIKDPKPEQLFIWLHALRYKTTEWDWKSETPYWAEESWQPGDSS